MAAVFTQEQMTMMEGAIRQVVQAQIGAAGEEAASNLRAWASKQEEVVRNLAYDNERLLLDQQLAYLEQARPAAWPWPCPLP